MAINLLQVTMLCVTAIKLSRHVGRDSHWAILPNALRVNANPFQTDLCRHPGYRDVIQLAILGNWIPAFLAGMTSFSLT